MINLAISGLPAGGMYALAALGIVLIYRTTGTLSFAQGAIATATAFVFNWLWHDHGVPLAAAMVLALGISVLLGLALELVMRAIGEGQVLAQVIATLGASGLILYVCGRLFGEETKFVPRFFPAGTFRVLGVRISYDQLGVVLIAAGLATGIALFLTRTRLGTAIRAASQNRLAAKLAGLPVRRLQVMSWAGGALLAGVAGILLAPLLFLDPVQLTVFFLVKPFAAAVVGGLSSLSVAFGAGLALGVTESMLTRYNTGIPGFTQTVPFLLIVVALLIRRRVTSGSTQPLVQSPARSPGTGRAWPGWVVVGACALVLMQLDTSSTTTFKVGVIFALVALSLVVLTGWVGQVSLAQAALFGVGGFMAANLANRSHLPFVAVILLVPVCVVPFAIVVGLPALRFQGLLLAVVTLAFGSLCYSSLFQWRTFTGGRDGSRLPDPHLFGLNLASGHRYALFCLAVTGLVFLATRNLGRFRFGRSLFGVRESEEGAASIGVGVVGNKLVAFAISGAIAGLAGALSAYSLGAVSFDQFSPFLSFTIFATVVLAGVESLWGAALAGFLYAVPPEILRRVFGIQAGAEIISSVGVIVILVLLPGGLTTLPGRLNIRVRERRASMAVLVPETLP